MLIHHTFSAAGKLVYGMQAEGGRELLFSVDIIRGAQKVLGDLGRTFHSSSSLMPGIRFSPVPDG